MMFMLVNDDVFCVQTWHKICFKCTECNMILNMKNYKGYNKMPYCNAYVYKCISVS